MKAFFDEFKAFAMRGNVVDLAVGIIIGAAFTSIVDSLVKDIMMPPLGKVLGGVDFSNFFLPLTLSEANFPTPDAAKAAGIMTINYGLFLNAIIKFIIVAFAVFILVKQLNRFKKAEAAAPPPPPPRSEVLLQEIRDLLKNR